MSATAEQRELAARIARDLFTFGADHRADRLVLRVEGPPPHDLGGWGERAMADRIADLLVDEKRGTP